MSLAPKGAKRADPAPAGYRMVQLINPAWYPLKAGDDPVKRPKGDRFAVSDELAAKWDAAGIAIAID